MESGEGNGKKGKWNKRWKEGDWGDIERPPPGILGLNLSTFTHDVSEEKNNCSGIRSYGFHLLAKLRVTEVIKYFWFF